MADEFGLIAASRPGDTSEAQLFAVQGDQEGIYEVTVCNQDSVVRTYRLAHTAVQGTVENGEYKAYGKSIPANGNHKYVLYMAAGNSVVIQASAADVISFSASGLTITE